MIPGSGFEESITNQTADWVYHDPTNLVTSLVANPPTQMNPVNPGSGQSVDLWVKVGYDSQVNTCFIYYTTDGSTPDGAFGFAKGTSKVAQAFYITNDAGQGNVGWWKGTIPGQSSGTQVSYKIGFFSGGSANPGQDIGTISDGESSGSKLFGLTQFAITNFDPTSAVLWLHNDLNTNNMTIGLQSGFHIARARTFLPRPGQSSVYNTFLQTFYYAGPLPSGVVVYPGAGNSLTSPGYTVVVRADSTVANVQFNIQDSNPANDDGVTGRLNGNGNGTNGQPSYAFATQVTPNQTLDLQYPNDLQEFRFVYTNIPASGTATICVKLNDYASGVLTNRSTLLSTTVSTLAPVETVFVASPATNNTVLPYSGSNTTYLVQACFSTTLVSAATNFNLLINGDLQPQSSYLIRPEGSVAGCAGYKSLLYNWSNPSIGTNLIQVIYTNNFTPVSDTRSVVVAPPLQIGGILNNNQLVVWNSLAGVNYQVLATTNLAQPFRPISGLIPGTGTTSSFFDANPAAQKFYEIEMIP